MSLLVKLKAKTEFQCHVIYCDLIGTSGYTYGWRNVLIGDIWGHLVMKYREKRDLIIKILFLSTQNIFMRRINKTQSGIPVTTFTFVWIIQLLIGNGFRHCQHRQEIWIPNTVYYLPYRYWIFTPFEIKANYCTHSDNTSARIISREGDYQ